MNLKFIPLTILTTIASTVSADCTGTFTDQSTNHFTTVCAETTVVEAQCVLTISDGFYGGSVTCNSVDTYVGIAATICNTVENAATVTCSDGTDQVAATCINGYSLDSGVCVETVDLIADNAASKMERELSCRDYNLAHIHIEKAIHFFQSALHKEIQCGQHPHDEHHDEHHEHHEHHDQYHTSSNDNHRYGEYHDEQEQDEHHDHPSQVTWGADGWRTHASAAGGNWENWLGKPKETLTFTSVDAMCQKAHKSCAFGHDSRKVGPRRLSKYHRSTTVPLARGLSNSVINLSLQNIAKNICRIQDIERRTRDIKAGLVAWDSANEAISNKCTSDCDGCNKCTMVGVRSLTDGIVANQMFCLDRNCKDGHTFSSSTAHILLNEVGASDSEIGNCVLNGRRLRGMEEQQAKDEKDEAKHMFQEALESFKEAKSEEKEAKAQAMSHKGHVQSSVINSHIKLKNTDHTAIMPKVLEGLNALKTLYKDIEPLYVTLNPSTQCADDSYEELINWVEGFNDIIAEVGDYLNTRLDRFDSVLSGVGTPMTQRTCQPDI